MSSDVSCDESPESSPTNQRGEKRKWMENDMDMVDVIKSPDWEKLIQNLGKTLENSTESNEINSETTLHYAAWTCNEEMLRRFITENPNCVNMNMHFNITALHLASYQGFNVGVDLLLQNGVDAKCRMQESDVQPIHIVASRGFVPIIKCLLEAGATVEDKDATGNTALHWASGRGQTSCVRELLRKADDVKDRDDANDPPLCLAMPKVLSESKGIIVGAKNISGNTPLHLASYFGHLEAVKLLLEESNIPINEANELCNTPLHYAVSSGNLEIVQMLLKQPGIQVNMKNCNSEFTLSRAARTNNPDIVRALVHHPEILVNHCDFDGLTPLHIAAKMNHPEVVQILLKHKDILVNKKDDKGRAPLHLAAGRSPLRSLADSKNSEALQKLLEGDLIPTNLKDNEVVQKLLEAYRIPANPKDNGEVVGKLVEADRIPANPKDNSEVVQKLLEADRIPANLKDNSEVVRVLLEAEGISVNLKDNHGNTPLHSAAQCCNLEALRVLLSAQDILLSEKNKAGLTPRDLPEHYWSSDDPKGTIPKMCVNELRDAINQRQ